MSVETVSTTHGSEYDFASNFLTLLSVSDSQIKLNDDYKKDLNELTRLGVKLPELPPFKTTDSINNSSNSTLYKASFKSIKPPKFNISLELDPSDTIYQVKANLINSSDELKQLHPQQLKFLIKGKVISDSSLVKSLTDNASEELKFTVMINKDIPIPSSTNTDESTVTIQEKSLPWDEIHTLLSTKGFTNSDEIITRLQKGWELTK